MTSFYAVTQLTHIVFTSLFKKTRLSGVLCLLNGCADFFDQFTCVLEVAINTCEPDERDLIGSAQVFHHAFSDVGRRDFLVGVSEYILLYFVSNLLNLFCGDGSFVTGLLQAGDDFVPVVGDSGLVFFDDVQLEAIAYFFVGGKTFFARQTLSSASDYSAGIA